MKLVTAYRCDFCKKLYMRRGMCATHEDSCLKNPQNVPLCYTCKHYKTAADTEDIRCPDNLGVEGTEYNVLQTYPHRCKLLSYKLYRHTAKVREDMEEVLRGNGYIPMPTPTCGCENYEYEEFF